MATKARIQGGVVFEILTANPFPPFHHDLIWVDCPVGTKQGDLYDGVSFSEDVAGMKRVKSSTIQAAAQAAIIGGFPSSALGAANTYPSAAIDQQNINAVALVGGSLWCFDATGKWAFVPHTKAQAAAVQVDMVAWIQAQQTKNITTQAAITAATTAEAVQAIVW